MTARTAGRQTRRWRTLRARILRSNDICALCGHPGSDGLDHVIPLSVLKATGQMHLAEDISNVRPAHSKRPCPVCGQHCNVKRGSRPSQPPERRSRAW